MSISFNMQIMEDISANRSDRLTWLFQAASNLGEIEGYILVTALIYVMFDKRLAIRLGVLVTLTMSFNHLLKIIIGNPRPFITDGDYLSKWAVPLGRAQELASEYSTPSGHAMAGAAFYTFLIICVRRNDVRAFAVLAIILTGLSRPYLGVHYVEDILIGWIIGIGLAVVAAHYTDQIASAWHGLLLWQRLSVAIILSIALWITTIMISYGQVAGQPLAFLGYTGAFTGIILAYPLERDFVNFDPQAGALMRKMCRFVGSVAMALLTLEVLGGLFSVIAVAGSVLSHGLQYVRYVVVGVVIIFLAPLLFTRLKLVAGDLDRARGSTK